MRQSVYSNIRRESVEDDYDNMMARVKLSKCHRCNGKGAMEEVYSMLYVYCTVCYNYCGEYAKSEDRAIELWNKHQSHNKGRVYPEEDYE